MSFLLSFGIFALAALGLAHYWALAVVPPDLMMGDVYRIFFIHVPSAWMAMVFFFFNFVGSLGYLIRRQKGWDKFAVSSAEVGLVATGLALSLGSIWGKPTWGIWWTWDPRLTTTALLFVMYSGYMILRRILKESEKQALLSSAVGLLVFLNVPIVYLSVKWWRSLHQVQSSPSTMAPEMVLTLRMSALALLFLCLFFLIVRMRLAKRQALWEERRGRAP